MRIGSPNIAEVSKIVEYLEISSFGVEQAIEFFSVLEIANNILGSNKQMLGSGKLLEFFDFISWRIF